MVIDLVMVTAPNPPGSRQLMMPGLAVLEIAPAKVLHGAVRLHGLTSSPTPETQVRVACAWASVVMLTSNRARTKTFFIVTPPSVLLNGNYQGEHSLPPS